MCFLSLNLDKTRCISLIIYKYCYNNMSVTLYLQVRLYIIKILCTHRYIPGIAPVFKLNNVDECRSHVLGRLAQDELIQV